MKSRPSTRKVQKGRKQGLRHHQDLQAQDDPRRHDLLRGQPHPLPARHKVQKPGGDKSAGKGNQCRVEQNVQRIMAIGQGGQKSHSGHDKRESDEIESHERVGGHVPVGGRIKSKI